jgi:hypothetical protein
MSEVRQGQVWAAVTEEELRQGLEQAFDYRGDVTLTLKDGSRIEGYIFDRRSGATLAESAVRIIPSGRREKLSVSYSDVGGVEFTGRDTAAGKSWEAWVKRYVEKRAAGETGIELKPDNLD